MTLQARRQGQGHCTTQGFQLFISKASRWQGDRLYTQLHGVARDEEWYNSRSGVAVVEGVDRNGMHLYHAPPAKG